MIIGPAIHIGIKHNAVLSIMVKTTATLHAQLADKQGVHLV